MTALPVVPCHERDETMPHDGVQIIRGWLDADLWQSPFSVAVLLRTSDLATEVLALAIENASKPSVRSREARSRTQKRLCPGPSRRAQLAAGRPVDRQKPHLHRGPGPAPSPSHCAYVRIQRSPAVGWTKADTSPWCRLVLVQVVTGNRSIPTEWPHQGVVVVDQAADQTRRGGRDRHQLDTQSG